MRLGRPKAAAGAALAVVGLAVAGLALAAVWATRRPPAEVPVPDLAGAHPRVAAKVSEARDAVVDAPRSAEGWGEYGMALMAHEYRAEAARAFAEAARLDPGDFRWAYYLGSLGEDADLQEAVRWYDRAAAVDGDRFPVRLRLGNALLRLGDFERAEREFRAAAKKPAARPYAELGLARVAAARSDLADARRLLENAVALPGWDARSGYVELARVCRRLGDRDAATRAEERAAGMRETPSLEIPDPLVDELETRDVLSRRFARLADAAAARGDLASAERSYRLLARTRPDLPGASLNLAQVLVKQGRPDEAVGVLRAAVERFPDDVLAVFQLATALDDAGDAGSAEAEYRRCLRLKPDFADAWYRLGLLLKGRQDVAAAREAFARAVDLDGRHLRARVALGLLLHEAGEGEEAVELLKTAVEQAPDDPVPAHYLRQVTGETGPPARSTKGERR